MALPPTNLNPLQAFGLDHMPGLADLSGLLISGLSAWWQAAAFLKGWAALALGLFLVSLFRTKKDEELARSFFAWASAVSGLLSFGALIVIPIVARALGRSGVIPSSYWRWNLIGLGVGLLLHFIAARYLAPKLNALQHRAKRRTGVERNRRTDARTVQQTLPQSSEPFDPSSHFKRKPQKDGVFVGLDEHKKPIYVPYKKFQTSHVQIVGGTGSGKGVATAVLLAQALRAGEAVFVLDPKNDEWAPSVLAAEAARAGVPFRFVDLNRDVPQLDFLAGISVRELEEVFLAAFSLAETGEAADFYRLGDRRYARLVAEKLPTVETPTVPGLFRAMPDDTAKNAAGFHAKLDELARVVALSGVGGVDLRETVDQGGVVYIVGSMRNQRIVTAQRALLIRLIQLAEARDRTAATRTIAIFLDEVKYHISRAALEGLGAVRDKNAHILLTHQSVEDLRDCPADLNADAVVGAVEENCRLRLAYRVQSPNTAEWLARATGTILVDDEMRQVEANWALAETVDLERHIRQAERYQVDENQFLNLPDRVAVLLGTGLPRFVHVSPIPTKKRHIEAQAVDVAPELLSTVAELPEIESLPPITDQEQLEPSTVVQQFDDLPPI